jgi:uncharacterized SAM-binding protein YcdF (DUF218 family)
MSTYFVIFGAAVEADGTPSGTVQRRVEGALAAARGVAGARFLPTGGAGANGVVEAEVMRRLLREAGVPARAILVEGRAKDTLQSAFLCDALLKQAGDADLLVPCTSRYHLPRCALLLHLLGWRVRIPAMPGDFRHLPFPLFVRYWAKEALALPYDTMLMLARRSGAPSDL